MFNQKSKLALLLIIILCAVFLSGCDYSWPHLPSPTDVIENIMNGLAGIGDSLQDMFQGFGGSIGF